MAFRKGSRRHGLAGSVFVIAMLSLGSSGAYLGFRKSEMDNVVGGVLTFYLTVTAWLTARRRDGNTGTFDWVALLVPLAVAAGLVIIGLGEARRLESPVGSLVGASLAVLLAAGDVRMLVRGLSGTQRIARHLWRMCFAWFVAAISVFQARQEIFPAILRKTGVLVLLTYLPLILMIFWLVRVWFAKAHKNAASPIEHIKMARRFAKEQVPIVHY
jgi:hypothetical protein